MDYHSDEERMTTAEQLAGHDLQAAAEAFSAIACDGEVGDEVRLSAAEHLAGHDPRAATEAFRGIPDDRPRHRHPLEGALTLTPPPPSRAPSPPRPPRPPR